jgi:Flp pilus assembly protein TadG
MGWDIPELQQLLAERRAMTNLLRRAEAQSLVEFALILPLLLILLMGVIDVGRLVFAYNNVSNAAREAGRTAIVNQTPATIREKAAQQSPVLGLPVTDPGGCPSDGGPTSANAGTCFAFLNPAGTAPCGTPAVGCTAVVSVKWRYQTLIPLVGDLVGPVAVSATTRQAVESICANNVPKPCPTR